MKAEETVEEVVIHPKDVVEAKYIRYRAPGGKLVNKVVLHVRGHDAPFVLRGKVVRQAFRYLPLSYSDVIAVRDYKARDAYVLRALWEVTTPLALSFVPEGRENRVIRVVSSSFVAIPHRVVIRAVESAILYDLEARITDRDLDTSHGLWANWYMDTETPTGDHLKVWAYNRNDGAHSLRIGAGVVIWECRNGMINWAAHSRLRLIHRGQLVRNPEGAIRAFVVRTVEAYALRYGRLRERAEDVALDPRTVRPFVFNSPFPKWIREAVWRRLERIRPITLWELSQAYTFVGTHAEGLTANYSYQLQRYGGRILEDEDLHAALGVEWPTYDGLEYEEVPP